MKRLAIFASGSGTNFQAIAAAVRRGKLRAKLALLVSDRKNAYVRVRAKRAKVPDLYLPAKGFRSRISYDKEIIRHLKRHKIDYVILAGFMRLLSPYFVRQYRNRILNLHPALLPAFKGTEGIKDALDYGVKVTGPTVHFVDERLDHGPIILQEPLRVEDSDTEETLAAKIHRAEHRIYPEAIRLLVEGRLKVVGRKVYKKPKTS